MCFDSCRQAEGLPHGHSRPNVNAVANYTFLTKATNLALSDRAPEDYFPKVEARLPGGLASQWIPTDPQLWNTDNHLDFLEARRQLLAEATNRFLGEAAARPAPDRADAPRARTRAAPCRPRPG